MILRLIAFLLLACSVAHAGITFDDASSEYLDVASTVVSTTPLTICAWINADAVPGDTTIVAIANSGNNTNAFRLGIDGTGDVVRAVTQAGAGNLADAVSSSGISTSTWHHACAVIASAIDRRAFLDGGNKGTDIASQTPSGLNATEIARRAVNLEFFSGTIAEVAIWSVALSDTNIADLYESAGVGLSPTCVSSGDLQLYWPLDDTADLTDEISAETLSTNGTPTNGSHPTINGCGGTQSPWFFLSH